MIFRIEGTKTEMFNFLWLTVKSPTVACLSRLVARFQKAYEGEIWCLCTLTFGQKVPKLNSRPVYCSQLYGTILVLFNPIWHWGNTFINVNCLKITDQQPEKLSTKLFKKVSLNLPMKVSPKLFTKFTSKLSQKLSLNCPWICSKNSQ